MKTIYKLLTYLLLIIHVTAAETRSWLTSSGKEIEASFVSFDSGTVTLKAESGKEAPLKVELLSPVDRLYLIENHDIPQEEVLGGYRPDHERKLKLASGFTKKAGTYEMPGGDMLLEFDVYHTPHFEVWSEGRINIKKVGLLLEQAWFYHAWRNPLQRDFSGDQKETIIITNTEEGIQHVNAWFIENNKHLTRRQLNSIEIRWDQIMKGISLPSELASERNISRQGYVIRMDAFDLTEGHIGQQFLTTYVRYLTYKNQRNTNVFNDHHGTSQYFVHAIGFDAELAYYGKIITGMGEETGGTHGYGSPKEFGRNLARAMTKKGLQIELNNIFSEKKDLKLKEEFAWQVVSYGRFAHSDMEKEIGTARFFQLGGHRGTMPSLDEMAECYGYKDQTELEDAFIAFLKRENLK